MAETPAEAGSPDEWEALWIKAFAAKPDHPDDYGPNQRSPSWSVPIELDRYVAGSR